MLCMLRARRVQGMVQFHPSGATGAFFHRTLTKFRRGEPYPPATHVSASCSVDHAAQVGYRSAELWELPVEWVSD